MTFMGHLKRVTTQVGLEKGLGLKSTSATQAIPCRFLKLILNRKTGRYTPDSTVPNYGMKINNLNTINRLSILLWKVVSSGFTE